MPGKSKAIAKDGEGKDSFQSQLKEVSAILEWFDAQDELDVEQALEKLKKAAELIKSGKKRLVEIENEFREIKKEIESD
jgi:exonuclease VII small subunit